MFRLVNTIADGLAPSVAIINIMYVGVILTALLEYYGKCKYFSLIYPRIKCLGMRMR